MNKPLLILFIGIFLYSCDCYQKASGIVLDNETKLPIEKVAFGKYEKVDFSNSYSSQTFTDNKSYYNYSSVVVVFAIATLIYTSQKKVMSQRKSGFNKLHTTTQFI
jgi:hypothetical protein